MTFRVARIVSIAASSVSRWSVVQHSSRQSSIETECRMLPRALRHPSFPIDQIVDVWNPAAFRLTRSWMSGIRRLAAKPGPCAALFSWLVAAVALSPGNNA